MGRTTTLSPAGARTMAGHLAKAGTGHPWIGWSFSAGWGSRETLHAVLVRPDVVVEVSGDVARDSSGRFRHPVRLRRVRDDLTSGPI
ncbi:hypothetical protein [Streptomyces sp. NPDC048256]|uniref:hypothetical protein n=1 Tax=unclassified Streptomyces TaxID=2593676 RepID=UPI0033F5BAB3